MFENINACLDEIAESFESADFRARVDIAARMRELFKRVEDLDKAFSSAMKDSHALEIGRFVSGASFEVKLCLNERSGIDSKALRSAEPGLWERYGTHIQYESLIYRAR